DDAGQPLLDLGSEQLEENLQRARREIFAEQLRLTYVALTRARDRLWLHWGPVALAKPKKDGSLAAEGLHTRALAWLLHGRGQCGEQPLQELGAHLAELNGSSLRTAIERLVGQSDGTMACLPLESRESNAQGPGRATPPQQLSQLNRSLYSAWRIG